MVRSGSKFGAVSQMPVKYDGPFVHLIGIQHNLLSNYNTAFIRSHHNFYLIKPQLLFAYTTTFTWIAGLCLTTVPIGPILRLFLAHIAHPPTVPDSIRS